MWRMRKQELLDILKDGGVPADPKWTVEELRAKVRMMQASPTGRPSDDMGLAADGLPQGWTRFCRAQLLALAGEHHIPVGTHETKGQIMVKLRAASRAATPASDHDVHLIGDRHAGETYHHIYLTDPEYCRWAVEAVEDEEGSSADLQRFAAYVKDKDGQLKDRAAATKAKEEEQEKKAWTGPTKTHAKSGGSRDGQAGSERVAALEQEVERLKSMVASLAAAKEDGDSNMTKKRGGL